MRFSILLATAFLLGICMLTSGLVCMIRGLELYQKEEAHNAIIRFLLGCVLLFLIAQLWKKPCGVQDHQVFLKEGERDQEPPCGNNHKMGPQGNVDATFR
ncbi:hypothetical protein HW555_000802 [Spodoptera exigua]|uniref:FXYD domain-containing ion transport regulator n=1 Tax=Spodoptera exigua TaxID=7107 RepID=A0A835GRA0_SPOEX|nr:hypothetical protein HW555_000802 [Spodoptera exigua]